MPPWTEAEALLHDAPGEWSAIVCDAGGNPLWDRAARVPRAAASTIKLAVLVALFRAVDAGQLHLDGTRVLGRADKVGGSGVLSGLHDGLALTLHDLAYLMIAISDNTASNLLIDAVGGLEAVNAAIRDLGLADTTLGRKFYGRPARGDERENVTTAADLAALLAAILAGRAAGPAASNRMLALLRAQQRRDRLARFLPPSVAYAGKSGSLPGMALDAGIIFAPAGPLIVAALAGGLPDPFTAEETMGRLARAALDRWGV